LDKLKKILEKSQKLPLPFLQLLHLENSVISRNKEILKLPEKVGKMSISLVQYNLGN
jgi:hypothetical protein